MRRGWQAALVLGTTALVCAGAVLALRLAGTRPAPAALAAGWGLAAANAGAAWGMNRWAMVGAADLFLRRTLLTLALRIPLLVLGLVALLMLTSLQARSLLAAFFGGYFGAMVWEIAMLHKLAQRA